MTVNGFIRDYIEKMKQIQEILLEYLEKNDNADTSFQN